MANFNLKAIISVVDRVSGPMKGINRAIGGMTKRFGDIGTAGGSLASAFGVQQIAQAAIDFESTMADVKKVVDFDTPDGFAAMKDDILEMSKSLPMAANGIGQIVAAAGQSGIAREELATFAEDAAKMGIAFDLSADEAGDMMAKWRVAFGMTQDQVRELADQVNYLGNTGPAKAAQISDVIRRVGALGDVGGVQAKYVAALGASISGVGVESEVAATATKNFILAMAAGEAATKGQKKAFAALGIDTVKLSKAMQKDATGAFTKVLAAIEKLPKDRQASVMAEIFGKESLGAIAPLLKNLPNLRENIAKVSDATRFGGSMNKEYEARAATTANAIQLMNNRWEALKITLGDALLPTLNELMGPLGGLIDQLAAFAKANPELTKYALLLVAIAGAVGVAGAAVSLLGGAVMSTLGSVLRMVWALGVLASRIAIAPAVLALRGALLAARGAMILFNVAMAANPIGAVVAAVALLAGAVYLLYDNWGPVSAWFTGQWDAIKLVFSGFMAFLSGVFTGDFTAAMDGLKTIGQGLQGWFEGWGNAISAVFSKISDWIKSVLNIDIAGSLREKLAALTGALPTWVTDKLGLSVAAGPAGDAPSVAGGGSNPVLAAGAAQPLRGAVDININGAPAGTRVETRSDTKGVAFNADVGYRSMALGGP
ncbi:TP901 family phage tail tape measure protein [Azospirillum brasilense]|nr:TP901 family phage tail tape measure protein [Azospirillum brasilense]